MAVRHFYEGKEITQARARELVRTCKVFVLRASPSGVPWRLGGGPGPWLEYATQADAADNMGLR